MTGLRYFMLLLAAHTATVVGGPIDAVSVCTSFSCDTRQSVSLGANTWHELSALFQSVPDAAAERAAISKAIALLERTAGQQTATQHDKAYNWQRAGEPGELDCIAESNNTHTYLVTLENAGLLYWHRTQPRAMRGLFFVHWTAVLQDTAEGQYWAIDSWFRDNGQPPVILPLADWQAYKEPDN